MRVDAVDDARAPDASLRRPPVVAVELQVGEVRTTPADGMHGLECRPHVAGGAEVVAVDVSGVRKPKGVGGVDERLDDEARRDA